MSRTVVVCLACLVAVSVCGCGGETAAPAAQSGQRVFGVVFQTMNNPFFVELNRGLEEVIAAHGDQLCCGVVS